MVAAMAVAGAASRLRSLQLLAVAAQAGTWGAAGRWAGPGRCCRLAGQVRRPVLRAGGGMAEVTEVAGWDSEGNTYRSVQEMWAREAGVETEEKEVWYRKGVEYWQEVPASVDGVLGGHERVSKSDLTESHAFLRVVAGGMLSSSTAAGGGAGGPVALDCGAGVGRVSKGLLAQHFWEVDLVEPCQHFLEAAKADLGGSTIAGGRIQYHLASLQDFEPVTGRYDVIWVQWCIGHLTDEDLTAFFQRAKAALKPESFIFLKENICTTGFVVDKVDSSVTRSDEHFRSIFKRSGLEVHAARKQRDFPKELFAVQMYALTSEARAPGPGLQKKHSKQKPSNQPAKIL